MYDGGISIETYSEGAGTDVASMVDNKQLKSTATLPLYIKSESAVSRTNFMCFCYLYFMKEIQIFGFPCCSTREHLSIDVLIANVGLTLTKLGDFSSSAQVKIQFRKKNSNF